MDSDDGDISALQPGRSQQAAVDGAAVIRRVTLRLVPFLIVCYFVSWLDRSNLSFAALQLNGDLKLSSSAYGFAAGIFFVTYCLCEVPSILLLRRYGPRKWIARIMLAWGLCATALALAQGVVSLSVTRLLLGAAEAGFYPCVLFFLSSWFPNSWRSRVMALFITAVPLSGIIGSPFSAALLSLEGRAGLHGWQWLFIIEGLLAVALAPLVGLFIQDSPAEARWLRSEERVWLEGQLAGDQRAIGLGRGHSMREALTHPWVWFMGAVYFTNVCLLNSIIFFLPQIVKGFGLSDMQTGFVVTLPSFLALFALIFWARHSDSRQERYGHAALANICGGIALLLSVLLHDPASRIVVISISYACTLAFVAPFWAIPASFLGGSAAAGGIAAISAIGVFGGFLAPWAIGFLRDLSGTYTIALGSIGCLAVVTTLPFHFLGRQRQARMQAAAQ